MSSIFNKRNGILVLLAVVLIGCKVGGPADRNVQISRHFGVENPLDSAPETRLARSGISNPASKASLAASSPSDRGESNEASEPVIESLSDVVGDSPTRTMAAKQPAESSSSSAAVDWSSPEAELMKAAGLNDEELADLIAAFRDSPPEVQQQAIRQLIAAASVRAQASKNPVDITEQLKRSLDKLPMLPDEIVDSGTQPTRLAAIGGANAAGNLGPVAPQTAPESAEQASEKSPSIAQAVVSGDVEESTVAKVSSTSGDSTMAATIAAVAADDLGVSSLPSGDPTAQPEKEKLYSDLLSVLSTAQPGESDGDRFRRDLARRYLLVLSGDPDSAVSAMEGLTKPEQEFLRNNLLAVWKLTDPSGHPVASRRFAGALASHRNATRHLAEATEQLEVKSLAFCTEIISFGQVKRFPTTRFASGQKVILYCEIDNFVAEKTADGFETELQGSYEIFDAQGTKVAGQVLPTDRQRCDHYLRDYFIAYQMHLPGQLEPGKYRLELTMECGKGKKYGQANLPLEIK
jgi:hypothetical protein